MSDEWQTARLPKLYTAAQRALEKARTVDECLVWKNKATAMASYARQLNDRSMLDDANEIRNRARRRIGQLGNEREPQRGARTDLGSVVNPGRQAAAREAGISEYERKRAQRIAAMPEEEFERNVKDPSLGEQRGQIVPGTIRCPHCGGVIVL